MLKPRKPTRYAERDAALHRQDELQAALALANQDRYRAVIAAEVAEARVATLRRKVESFHRGILLGVPAAGVAGYLAGQFL